MKECDEDDQCLVTYTYHKIVGATEPLVSIMRKCCKI